MLSKKTRYALKALMLLAGQHDKKEPVLISELAKTGKMPQKFLESILLELRKNGILQSKKGKGGGYFFQKSPKDVNFGQVIRMMEGPIALLPCVSQTAYMSCNECTDEASCGIRALFKEVRDATAQILDSTTVAKVFEVQQQLQTQPSGNFMYFI